jgi:lipoprotein-anchoring transpeptidase ErfK/SrfK
MPLEEPEQPAEQLQERDSQIAAIPEEEPEIMAPPTATGPGVDPSLVGKDASDAVAKIQILLDRAGLSPGVIDGQMGDNVNKAISAYKNKTQQALRTYDPASIDAALAETGGDAFTEYTITAVDAAGPYVASVPEDYGEKAKLDRLPYTSVVEALAERFHMDERYLRALNPGSNFDRPGTVIKVANVGEALTGTVARIVADKRQKQVRAYDASGRLLAAYPATIGSTDTPSPTGTVTVERIAFDPEYTYNPNINFKQGENHRVLTIPPGPNGPVGSIWIALSKPTYGIHGTPEPSKIGKTFSHGCVRLTNWDATELAKMVTKGVTVEFLE